MHLTEKIFTDKNFYKTLLALAIPIVLQNLITSSLNMVDTIMIGAVGENEVAAVGIANQVFFLYTLLMIGIASGCGVFISQFWGNQDKGNIKKVLGLGLLSVLVLGTVFTAAVLFVPETLIRFFSKDPTVIVLAVEYLRITGLSYIATGVTLLFSIALRSIGKAKLPMLISAASILINTAFNYILIFGKLGAPAMGVEGAAIATVIARTVEVLCILLFSLRPDSPLAGKLKTYLAFSGLFMKKVFGTMIPVILNEGCWGLGMIFYAIAYGKIGTQAQAAIQICTTVQNLFLVVCFGIAGAALVMIGNEIGAGNEARARDYARELFRLAILLGFLLGATLILLTPSILSLFSKVSQDVLDPAANILRIFAFSAPIRVLNCLLIIGIFRGGGDAAFALKTEAATMWGIGIPLAFLGAMIWHCTIAQVFLLITLEEVVKFMVCVIRLKSNRWSHNMISGL